MAEVFNNRVKFLPSGQKDFLDRTMVKLNISDLEMSKLLNISQRTFLDWKKEKYLMTLKALNILIEKTGLGMPSNIRVLPAYWSVQKAAKLGAQATIKKYGKICSDEKKRKNAWQKWWETEGRFLKNMPTSPKRIYLPQKSEKLAEFFGILLGDGGITDYQVTITLNRITDKKYSYYVCSLIDNLFHIKAGRNYCHSVVNIRISRKKLVSYLVKLGLKKGNKIKQQIDIPQWIKNNIRYSLACLRGLVDTDGSFFTHSYKSNNKRYYYRKISFSSRSKELTQSVIEILESIKLCPRIDFRGDIRLNNISDVKRYYKIVGSKNQKHIEKYVKCYGEVA